MRVWCTKTMERQDPYRWGALYNNYSNTTFDSDSIFSVGVFTHCHTTPNQWCAPNYMKITWWFFGWLNQQFDSGNTLKVHSCTHTCAHTHKHAHSHTRDVPICRHSSEEVQNLFPKWPQFSWNNWWKSVEDDGQKQFSYFSLPVAQPR